MTTKNPPTNSPRWASVHRTRRGLREAVMLDFSPGGRAYGYSSEPVQTQGKRRCYSALERRAKAHHSAGGACYGYTTVPAKPHNPDSPRLMVIDNGGRGRPRVDIRAMDRGPELPASPPPARSGSARNVGVVAGSARPSGRSCGTRGIPGSSPGTAASGSRTRVPASVSAVSARSPNG